jgi:hypothetical protein
MDPMPKKKKTNNNPKPPTPAPIDPVAMASATPGAIAVESEPRDTPPVSSAAAELVASTTTSDEVHGSEIAPPADPPVTESEAAEPVLLPHLGLVVEVDELTVPIGYATRHVECKLTPRQAAVAKMGATLIGNRGERALGGRSSHPDGTLVEYAGDFVRWMLDRVADDVEQASGKSLVDDYGLQFR